MCLSLLLTSRSFICALVIFFFFFALNFISPPSSPEFAALPATLGDGEPATELTALDARPGDDAARAGEASPGDANPGMGEAKPELGREPPSSKRSIAMPRWPLWTSRPSLTCHCSGHNAPTNSSLWLIITTPPLKSRIAIAKPPSESRSRKLVGSSSTRMCGLSVTVSGHL